MHLILCCTHSEQHKACTQNYLFKERVNPQMCEQQHQNFYTEVVQEPRSAQKGNKNPYLPSTMHKVEDVSTAHNKEVCVCGCVVCMVGRPTDITGLWDYGKTKILQFHFTAMQSKCNEGSEQGEISFSQLVLYTVCVLQNSYVET